MLKINLSRNREEANAANAPVEEPGNTEEMDAIPPETEPSASTETILAVSAQPPEPSKPDSPEEELVTEKAKSRKKPSQEKVPLSDRVSNVMEEIRASVRGTETSVAEPEKTGEKDTRGRVVILMVALLLAIGCLVYFQRDFFSGLIPVGKLYRIVTRLTVKPSPPAPTAPTPPTVDTSTSPAEGTQAAGSDPVLATIDGINTATPPRVWLTSATVGSDGSYKVAGIAFSHEAVRSFSAGMERRGAVTGKTIPPETKAPDAVYKFLIEGKLGDIRSPEILDAIPAGRLSALGDSLRAMSKTAGIVIVRLPKPDGKYGGTGYPFELEGSYPGLKKLLGEFLSNREIVIDRMSIRPAASGKPYNRVRISFSLRTVSAI